MKRIATIVLVLATLSAATPAHACGWYLLTPPLVLSGENQVRLDAKAPLSTWSSLGAFDTAEGCEEFLARTFQDNPSNRDIQRAFGHARCIASDDPRLAR